MSNKKAATYTAVFKYFDSIYSLQPTSIITDFENGMRKALKLCYPSIRLNGCWFQFCYALRRKALKLKLHKSIYQDEGGNLIFYQIKCIPLLPESLVETGFKIVKKNARKIGIYKRFSQLFKYFETYWLKVVSYFIHILFIHA